MESPDDAAIYRMDDETALVVTTDFFPPVVDDPYRYGRIAAANAMSDVFAMGGEVLLALNLLALPEDLPAAEAQAIVRGGAEAVREAGGVVAGGHSVTDREPKYGLAVVGRVHPERYLSKSGALPGDVLVLTKPLGSGLVTTALKQGKARADDVEAASACMARLNRSAGQAALSVGARSATDITGYALAGHALEMAGASGVDFDLVLADLPLLPGARHYAEIGCVPGGTWRNRSAFIARIDGLEAAPPHTEAVLFDPQTSGGLLIAVPESGLAGLLARLKAAGSPGQAIGRVRPGSGRLRLHTD